MHTSTEPEWHPWLKLFTIMSIPVGLICLIPGCSFLSDSDYMLDGIGLLVLGVAVIAAGINTLRATDYFRRWNSGVSQRDKLIAYIAIYLGVNMTIALFFVAPFMRFITDAVGGGLGVNRRA